MKNSFVMYTDYQFHIELLKMEQRGMLFTAIMQYVSGEEVCKMDDVTTMAFSFIKARMDKDIKKYEEVIEARKKAGSKGGLAKASNAKQNIAKASSAKQGLANVAVNVNDNDNVNDDDINKKYTCAFEEFWKSYPRKIDKGNAYKKFTARVNAGYAESDLIKACENYASECIRNSTEKKYIKHASTFLSEALPFLDYINSDTEVHANDSTDNIKDWLKEGDNDKSGICTVIDGD